MAHTFPLGGGGGGQRPKKKFVYLKWPSTFRPLSFFARGTIFLMWVGRWGGPMGEQDNAAVRCARNWGTRGGRQVQARKRDKSPGPRYRPGFESGHLQIALRYWSTGIHPSLWRAAARVGAGIPHRRL